MNFVSKSLLFGALTLGLLVGMGDRTPAQIVFSQASPTASPAAIQFTDVAGDIYADNIQRAIDLGLVKGFPGENRFYPQEPITREQMVSLLVDMMQIAPLEYFTPEPGTPRVSLPPLPTQVNQPPFPDVAANRWSASKIEYAKSLGLIRGYEDRTFHPTQPVTRAELMVMLQKTDRYIVQLRNWDGREFFQGDSPLDFSDTQGHWAYDIIRGLSQTCRVSSPLNEVGTAFAPNQFAKRNFAISATVRSLQCLSIPPRPPS